MRVTKLPTTPLGRIKLFLTFNDARWEDLKKDNWLKTVYQDFSAGLIVAMTAIPMAMGFAMAMGMRPEHGIIAGAISCLIGRTFGGSKYQVYGPTAAFIPLIAAIISKYSNPGIGGSFEQAHGFLVLVSIISGIVLILMGIFGIGKYAKLVPNAIIVGFTIGIAVSIALTNFEDILGIENLKDFIGQDEEVKGGLLHNISMSLKNLNQINLYSVFLGLLTFVLARYLLKVSIYIPGPVIAMGISTILAATFFTDKNIILVKDLYGSIPNDFFKLQLPFLPKLSSSVLFDIIYFVIGIVFVSGVESILCSSMADRLAKNDRTPFSPDKEFFGQGLVQIVTPLVQGFPCTGALARTATSIRAGAKTPLAGYFKAVLKLTMAFYLAQYLELIPMACIGGILVWVASNMIKPSEIKEIKQLGKFDFSMMLYTAIMVPMTDFLTGVLSALIIYFLVKYAFKRIKKKKNNKQFD
jgi:SulP family sulfate permease